MPRIASWPVVVVVHCCCAAAVINLSGAQQYYYDDLHYSSTAYGGTGLRSDYGVTYDYDDLDGLDGALPSWTGSAVRRPQIIMSQRRRGATPRYSDDSGADAFTAEFGRFNTSIASAASVDWDSDTAFRPSPAHLGGNMNSDSIDSGGDAHDEHRRFFGGLFSGLLGPPVSHEVRKSRVSQLPRRWRHHRHQARKNRGRRRRQRKRHLHDALKLHQQHRFTAQSHSPSLLHLITPPWRGHQALTTRTLPSGGQSCRLGRCEMTVLCWLGGGRSTPTSHLRAGDGCSSLFETCCQKPGNKPAHVYRAEDRRRKPPRNYGPVRNNPICGINVEHDDFVAQRRIVGGREAGFGTFPWQAYVRIGMSRCGGSLVNRWWVVTAGHCVASAIKGLIRVTLGEYKLNSRAEPLKERVYRVTKIRVHPYFEFSPQADRYDVAVIKLNRPVQMAPHIRPICLPPKDMNMRSMMGTAAGWGALKPGSLVRPRRLQAVNVPVLDNVDCERMHKQKRIDVVIYDEMVCAGYFAGGRDSCQGDSGGPLMHQIEGRWTLIGIVSAGFSCAKKGQPGIYHRVAKTSDWISHIVNGS